MNIATKPEVPTLNPILAAFEDVQVQTFGQIETNYRGWSYVTFSEGHTDRSKIDHYAVCGNKVVALDLSPYEVMPRVVFEWMVQLDFPTREEIASCSTFNFSSVAPLTKYDVERIWLWRRVSKLAA